MKDAKLPRATSPGVSANYNEEVLSWASRRRFFDTVAGRLASDACEILLIGDDPQCDVCGARNAGWQAMLLDRTADIRRNGVLSGAAWPPVGQIV